MPLTPSEQLVYDLCKKSFLSLWSYANPRQPKGKELCDVLAVFGRHLIVFSVKDITLKPHADPKVAADRWIRKAVDESIDQLKGARRMLATMEHVIRSDGADGIRMPPASERIVHSIAVAAGGNREVPFGGGTRDGEYVHVLDEKALREILAELDTAPDFIQYLDAKEAYRGSIMCEGEENVFAHYLHSGRTFPEVDMMFVEDGLWTQVQAKPEFKERKAQDRISYWWDEHIERLVEDCIIPVEASAIQNQNELVVRAMASESRFERRLLSNAFVDWLQKKQAGGRFMFSPRTQTGYVFLTSPRDHEREYRAAELHARCLVARSPRGPLAQAGYDVEKVIGLATEVHDPSGYSMDVIYLEQPEWTEDDDRIAEEGRALFGILGDSAVVRRVSFDEFPKPVVPQEPRRRANDDVAKRRAKRKEARKSRKRNRQRRSPKLATNTCRVVP